MACTLLCGSDVESHWIFANNQIHPDLEVLNGHDGPPVPGVNAGDAVNAVDAEENDSDLEVPSDVVHADETDMEEED